MRSTCCAIASALVADEMLEGVGEGRVGLARQPAEHVDLVAAERFGRVLANKFKVPTEKIAAIEAIFEPLLPAATTWSPFAMHRFGF